MTANIEISIWHFRRNNVLLISNSLHKVFEIIADDIKKKSGFVIFKEKNGLKFHVNCLPSG